MEVSESETSEKADATKKGIWNSLEVAKLIASLCVPLAVVYYGQLFIDRRESDSRVAEARALAARKQEEQIAIVTRKRGELWDQMAPAVHDIYCYFGYTGRWEALGPDDALRRRNELVTIITTYLPYFSEEFLNAYTGFLSEAFTWDDVKLRTRADRPKDSAKFKDRFTGEENSKALQVAYRKLLQAVSTELGISRREASQAPTPLSASQASPASSSRP